MADAAGIGGRKGRYGIGVALALPEVGPRAAANEVEVADLHYLQAALAHEGQAAVEVEHLDAVGRGGEHPTHELGIGLLPGGGVALVGTVAQDLDEALGSPVPVLERHYLAVGPEGRPILAQMPALVVAAPVEQGRAHLLLGDLVALVLLGKEDVGVSPEHLGLGPPEDTLGPRVPARHAAVQVHRDDAVVDGALQDRPVAPVALTPLPQGATQFQVGDDLLGERAQGERLRRGQPVGLGVEDAQGAEGNAVRRLQGHAGVEPHRRSACDQGVVGGARIEGQIRDLEHVVLLGGVGAHGLREGGLAPAEAALGLEPLAFAVEQGDQRHRHAASLGRHRHDAVELGLRRRVQDVVGGQRSMASHVAVDVFHGYPSMRRRSRSDIRVSKVEDPMWPTETP